VPSAPARIEHEIPRQHRTNVNDPMLAVIAAAAQP
jgi:hypothetical protein